MRCLASGLGIMPPPAESLSTGTLPWGALRRFVRISTDGNTAPAEPVGLERMLRMYFVRHWFNLADLACEEALRDSTATLPGFSVIIQGQRHKR